jgi:formylmethanofuran dehydrogenase subunit B
MIYENITCSVCGMACEEILVDIDDDRINVENACLMGNAKLKELRSPHRIKEPYIDGKVAEWNEAMKKFLVVKSSSRNFSGLRSSIKAVGAQIFLFIILFLKSIRLPIPLAYLYNLLFLGRYLDGYLSV